MPLTTGTRLGPYEVLGPLGAGGMGEVYKARDTRLERTVAIKILPAHAADDPDFRARFDREAKTISQLNHPNICTLYDIGRLRAEGAGAGQGQELDFLVMEHLEGETLAARLQKGALPTDQVLTVACEIADALDKAHKKGIIHRDLKPANVMLTPTGSKLLDFGLAKPGVVTTSTIETKLMTTPPPGSSAPVGTGGAPLTARGTILGTFQYMAPEQIEGADADARTDIWAFGCVLYEMVTGKRPFEGKSQASLIAGILEKQPPPMTELQPMTPPALSRIVRTCLAKSPDDRFQTAHDLALQLEWIEEGGSAAGLPAPVIASRKRRERMTFAGIAVVVAMAAAAAAWFAKPAPPPAPNVVARFMDVLADDQTFSRTGRRVVALSADGTKLAYVANNQLYLRKLNEQTAQAVVGTSTSPSSPTFSPNGEWIAYWSNLSGASSDDSGYLWRVPVGGGTPTRLCQAGNPWGMSWDGNRIVWSTKTEIKAVADTGGVAESLVSVDAAKGELAGHPQLINDGTYLIYTFAPRSFADSQIVGQVLPSGERKVLVPAGASARVVRSGQIVYYKDSTLFAIAFDARSLTTHGGPVPMIQRVRPAAVSGDAQYSVSDSGTLAYLEGGSSAALELAWVDRKGRGEKIGAPPRSYFEPRLSPDGTRIASATRDDSPDIYVWDLRRSTETRVTVGDTPNGAPVWMPGSLELLFSTDSDGQADIYRRRVDLTMEADRVTNTKGSEYPLAVTPDSRMVLFHEFRVDPERLGRRLLGKDDAAAESAPVIGTSFPQRNGTLSADGRWLATEAREGDTWEVYVRPFPDVTQGRYPISQGGGTWPAWSPSGRELYFVSGRKLMVVPIKSSANAKTFDWDTPTALFDMGPYIRSNSRGYDVAIDGRFVMVQEPGNGIVTERGSIHYVSNWFDELRARVK
jgi:Tol biopolymer transport system component